MKMPTTRFIADWIVDMDEDESQVFSRSIHPTFDEAHAAALAGSKKADAIEWIAVREQQQDAWTLQWTTVTRWYGDWEQIEEDA
jgi:hypothetical protein